MKSSSPPEDHTSSLLIQREKNTQGMNVCSLKRPHKITFLHYQYGGRETLLGKEHLLSLVPSTQVGISWLPITPALGKSNTLF